MGCVLLIAALFMGFATICSAGMFLSAISTGELAVALLCMILAGLFGSLTWLFGSMGSRK